MARPPDPDYIRRMKGKKPKLTPEQQLAFKTELPDAPEWLDGEAVVAWNRMSLELHKVGILFQISRDSLARYCQSWADYSDMVIEDNKLKGAKRKVNQWNIKEFQYRRQVRREAEETMRKFESEYGLTPASATKIRRPIGAPTTKSPEGELEEFLEDGET